MQDNTYDQITEGHERVTALLLEQVNALGALDLLRALRLNQAIDEENTRLQILKDRRKQQVA